MSDDDIRAELVWEQRDDLPMLYAVIESVPVWLGGTLAEQRAQADPFIDRYRVGYISEGEGGWSCRWQSRGRLQGEFLVGGDLDSAKRLVADKLMARVAVESQGPFFAEEEA